MAPGLSPHLDPGLEDGEPVALVVEEVPIDVLADRLGTSRNALYKTLHDARQRLRDALTAGGHLDPSPDRRSR